MDIPQTSEALESVRNMIKERTLEIAEILDGFEQHVANFTAQQDSVKTRLKREANDLRDIRTLLTTDAELIDRALSKVDKALTLINPKVREAIALIETLRGFKADGTLAALLPFALHETNQPPQTVS